MSDELDKSIDEGKKKDGGDFCDESIKDGDVNEKSKTKKEENKKPLITQEILGRYKVNINTSTSKQMYTFPREERFKNPNKQPITEFYNLPSYISKKGTFIGYGNKSDLTKNTGKCQNIYNVPREFDLSRRGGSPKYTFGQSRDICKVPHDQTKNFPSPFSYSPYKPFGSESTKMSMYSRRILKDKNLYTPGPGSYGYMNINPNGRYADSGFSNSPRSCFGLDQSQRSGHKNNGYPGPGQYETKTKIGDNGCVFHSVHVSSPGKTMGIKLALAGSKVITPGPGAYNNFSDFEGFSKNK